MRYMAFIPHSAIKAKERSLSPLFPPRYGRVAGTEQKEDAGREFHQHLLKKLETLPKILRKKKVKSNFHHPPKITFLILLSYLHACFPLEVTY